MRVAANLAGALWRRGVAGGHRQPIVAMAIGVMVTGLVCYLLKQDDAQRPAFVAVIIVTIFTATANGIIHSTASLASSSVVSVRWPWDFYSTN